MNLLSILSVFFAVYCVNCQRDAYWTGLQCKSIMDCPPLKLITQKSIQDISLQEREILQKSHCGWVGEMPKVYCPQFTPRTTSTTTTTTTTTPRTFPISTTNTQCATPGGRPGQCVNIYSCPGLINMLQSGGLEGTQQYINSLKCSATDELSVCCELVVKSCDSYMNASPPDPSTRCCGVHSTSKDKIIGGKRTEPDQYPWLALIEYNNRGTIETLCGGALISGKYVLTAGHCVTEQTHTSGIPTNVRLGEYDTSNDGKDCFLVTGGGGIDCTDGVTRIPIESFFLHPQYQPWKTKYDIALIRLARTAPYTYFIRPICLPTKDVTLKSDAFNMTVAGWGVVSNQHQTGSVVKMDVEIPFVNQTQCESAYRVNLERSQFCAGGVSGKGSCKGDSGGPLMYDNNKIFEAVGIVSAGTLSCALENYPGIYTDVYEFNNWIRNSIVP